jgi:hypothetical protein
MTPADLDRIEALDALVEAGPVGYEEELGQLMAKHAPELLRLARRGLRAERETCGACQHYRRSEYSAYGGRCSISLGLECTHEHYCADWEERRGVLL